MSKKEIQRLTTYSVPEETGEDDFTFDASMFQTDTPSGTVTREEDGERQNIDERIQTLFPSQYEKQIPLGQLTPAPDKWNFFPEPDRETMRRLMQSILDYGLLHPAIVWQQEDGTYMILGGHTRYRALKNLLKLFPERAESLQTMRCNVYAHEKLDENAARQIIIMDNTTQRQQESKAIMITSVIRMGQLMKERRAGRNAHWYEKRKRINDMIGESLGVSTRTVTGIMRFRMLLPEFLPFLDKRTAQGAYIKQGQAQALTKLPQELQQAIYDEGLHCDEMFPFVPPKELATIASTDDLQKVFATLREQKNASEETEASRCETIHMDVPKEEYDAMRHLLWEAIQQSDAISEEAKQYAKAALNIN